VAYKLTSSEFHRRTDLPDWRVLLGRIEATYRAGTFERAAALVQQIAAAVGESGHQADLDLRVPDRVIVSMATPEERWFTTADVDLAATISQLAASAGATSDPQSASRLEVAIDAIDIDAVLPFWRAILGYEDEPPRKPGGQVLAIVDPHRIGPAFWFQQMDAPRPQRNRIHLDVTVPHDVAEERIAAAVAAGGRVLSDKSARAFWVLADPEGNEACICTWQDRD